MKTTEGILNEIIECRTRANICARRPAAQCSAVRILLLALAALSLPCSGLFAQGTAFTYQGRLADQGAPASGLYDLRFKLFTDSFGNNQAGNTLVSNAVSIANGLFMVSLDFGAGIFNGSNYWLEVDVKTNGAGAYANLTPLQPLTPAPYAIFAENVAASALAGTYTNPNPVTLNNVSNTLIGNFTGDGASLSNVDALTLNGLGAGSFWQVKGNNVSNGQFLGSTNNQPFEIWVNGLRALRFEPNTNGAPNVIGGAPVNYVDPGIVGATIGGGGTVNGSFFLGAGSNHVAAIFGTIAGGRMHTINADHGFIGGGISNTIQWLAYDGVIGGGVANVIATNAYDSVIAGGNGNAVRNDLTYAVIGGGQGNSIGAGDNYSTIAGGGSNMIQTNARSSTIGGGAQNTISPGSIRATIAGGINHLIGTNSHHSTISGGEANLVQTNSDHSTIAGGLSNNIQSSAAFASIGGGGSNSCSGFGATVAGGTRNSAAAYATVSGGFNNSAGDYYATVIGGNGNIASSANAVVAGGSGNIAAGVDSFAAGSGAQALHNRSFVWSDGIAAFPSTAPNQFAVAAAGGVLLKANVQLGLNTADYRQLSLGGGNSEGFLYGSYLALGDGVHLGYNYYYDAGGVPHLINSGGGSSRVSVSYGQIELAVGGIGAGPGTVMLRATTGGVCVNGTVNNCSDRNVKQNFAPVSSTDILEKVAQLPVSEWSYKIDPGTRHIGPVAQDFHSVFDIGTDDKHIAPIDEGGVALAAIQGLNQKLDARAKTLEAALSEKEREVQELRQRLDQLELLVRAQTERAGQNLAGTPRLGHVRKED